MNKVCKKCNRELPENYKSKYCERCKNIRIEKTKKTGLAALGVFGSLILPIVTKGKFKPRK